MSNETYLEYIVNLPVTNGTSATIKWVLAVLIRHKNKDNIAFPSISTIQKLAGIKKTATHEAIEALIKLGFISKEENYHIPPEYRGKYYKSNQNCYKIHEVYPSAICTSSIKGHVLLENQSVSRTSPLHPTTTSPPGEHKLIDKTQEKPPLKGGEKENAHPPSENFICENLISFAQAEGYSLENLHRLFSRVLDRAKAKGKPYKTHEQAEAATRIALQDDWLGLRKPKESVLYSELALAMWEGVSIVIELGDEGSGAIEDALSRKIISQLGGLNHLMNCEKDELMAISSKFKEMYTHFSKT